MQPASKRDSGPDASAVGLCCFLVRPPLPGVPEMGRRSYGRGQSRENQSKVQDREERSAPVPRGAGSSEHSAQPIRYTARAAAPKEEQAERKCATPLPKIPKRSARTARRKEHKKPNAELVAFHTPLGKNPDADGAKCKQCQVGAMYPGPRGNRFEWDTLTAQCQWQHTDQGACEEQVPHECSLGQFHI